MQQPEFEPAQRHVPAGDCHGMRRRIDQQLSTLEGRAVGRRLAPAQQGAHARNQFAHAEWLRYVIVSAEFEADDAVCFFGAGGQHHDGYFRKPIVAAHLTANFKPAQARQHEVQNNQIGLIPAHFGQRDTSLCCGADFESFFFEVVLEQSDEVHLIIHNQNLFQHDF